MVDSGFSALCVNLLNAACYMACYSLTHCILLMALIRNLSNAGSFITTAHVY